MATPTIYFDASYGGIPLLITRLRSHTGRDIAVQSPSRGSKHVLQDRGQSLLSTEATILFCDQPGKDDFLVRFDSFRSLVSADGAQVFSHPLLGSYSARISDVEIEADDSRSVVITCTILAENEPTVTFTAGAGVSTEAGLESVTDAATNATTQFTNAGLTPDPSIAASQLAVTNWTTNVAADILDSAQVLADVATVTNAIDAAVVTLELTSDLALWTLYQAMILLRYQVTRAAESVTATQDQLFNLTVIEPRPLRSIMAEIYGASLAEEMGDTAIQLNRIYTPGLIPAGTVLILPLLGAQP